MKKINIIDKGEWFIPSVSEIIKAAQHLRGLMQQSSNYFACEYYPESGNFRFSEFVDPISYTAGAGVDYVYIPCMNCDTPVERVAIAHGIRNRMMAGLLYD